MPRSLKEKNVTLEHQNKTLKSQMTSVAAQMDKLRAEMATADQHVQEANVRNSFCLNMFLSFGEVIILLPLIISTVFCAHGNVVPTKLNIYSLNFEPLNC